MKKIGYILDRSGNPCWQVVLEENGNAVVKHALDFGEDDIYACLDDLKDSIAPGYSYRSVVNAV